ncbi:MAG: alpha/beta hydrolase [Oscillospiraceae bacterium]|nr:alpha/beta hydrolase [Oscillospiraceae bacterium]
MSRKIRIEYADAGAGEPLFLLHGNGESHAIFEKQIAYFSATRRVIAPDTRGHGGTPRGEGPFTIPRFADDLKDLFDELHIERADVLGFSDGGNIAIAFALRCPERVRRLVLNGANLRPSGVKAKYQLPITAKYFQACAAPGRDERSRRRRENLGLMVHWPRFSPSDLRRITAPTLVLAGTDDMIKESHTRLIASSLPNARLVFLPGSHFIVGERPDEYNAAVERFFEETEDQ